MVTRAMSVLFRDGLVELLWPSADECLVCEFRGSTVYPFRICPTCLLEFLEWTGYACPNCGYPVERNRGCPRCDRLDRFFETVRAVGIFRKALRTAIHKFKYRGVRELGITFGSLLSEMIMGEFRETQFDLMLSVPIHPASLRIRGFNQSEDLARRVARNVGIPFSPVGIRRIKHTPSQTTLNPAERARNLSEAFRADPEVVYGKRVLLVDDVITTGATANECARSLIRAGARKVHVAVLATAIYSV